MYGSYFPGLLGPGKRTLAPSSLTRSSCDVTKERPRTDLVGLGRHLGWAKCGETPHFGDPRGFESPDFNRMFVCDRRLVYAFKISGLTNLQ